MQKKDCLFKWITPSSSEKAEFSDKCKPSVKTLRGQQSQSGPKTLIASVSICHLAYPKLRKAKENNPRPLERSQSNGRRVKSIGLAEFNHSIQLLIPGCWKYLEACCSIQSETDWGKWDRHNLIYLMPSVNSKFDKHLISSELNTLRIQRIQKLNRFLFCTAHANILTATMSRNILYRQSQKCKDICI